MNKLLSILLSITIVFVIISLTILNKNYIIHEFNKYDYYQELSNEVNKDTNEYTKEINKYIKSKYTYKIDNSLSKILNKYDIKLITDIINIISIILVIITGIIFNKTKDKHNINKIFLYTSLLIILFYGITYIMINISNNMIYKITIDALHILLSISIVMLFYYLFNKYKCKIYKLLKIK